MKTDAWLEAARILRQTVLNYGAVAMVQQRPPYETRGRGRLVRGLALRDEGAVVTVHTGVILHRGDVLAASIDHLTHDLRHHIQEQGRTLLPGRDLAIYIDVLDLAP